MSTPKETVQMLQCSRRKCGCILFKFEYAWTKPKGALNSRTALCPDCGGEAFYHLSETGQRMTYQARRESERGYDPMKIQPYKRLGARTQRLVEAAKRRGCARFSPNPLYCLEAADLQYLFRLGSVQAKYLRTTLRQMEFEGVVLTHIEDEQLVFGNSGGWFATFHAPHPDIAKAMWAWVQRQLNKT